MEKNIDFPLGFTFLALEFLKEERFAKVETWLPYLYSDR